MLSRRSLLRTTVGAAVGSLPLVAATARAGAGRKKLAVVTTEWRYRSHAWHMAERFLVGYPRQEKMAPAAARRGLGLCRPNARQRPEP